jgi:hypothetical protein
MSCGKFWTFEILVMVKNGGHITLVRITVFVLFLLTIGSEYKSEARDSLFLHGRPSKNRISIHPFAQNPDFPSLTANQPAENLMSFSSENPLFFASLSGRNSGIFMYAGNPQQSGGSAPELICPEDISIYTDINACTSFISGNLNPEFDPAGVTALTWEMTGATEDQSPAGGINLIDAHTFNEGTTIITYTAKGTGGTTATCTFTVTISDNQVPRMESLPGNITVAASEGTCSGAAFWIEPTATDNCTPDHLIIKEASARPGDLFPVGTTQVYYRAIDGMGNESAVQSFTVTVEDRELPVLETPENLTVQCGEEIPAAWSSLEQFLNAGGFAMDNCRLDETTFRLRSETTGNGTCPYTLTRIYEISDIHGNTAAAAHTIEVTGEEPETELQPETTAEEEG